MTRPPLLFFVDKGDPVTRISRYVLIFVLEEAEKLDLERIRMPHSVTVGYSNSVTWESSVSKEKKAYSMARLTMERYCPKSFLQLEDFNAWVDHRQAMMDYERSRDLNKIKSREQEKLLRCMGIPKTPRLPFRADDEYDLRIKFPDNLSPVLCLPSIWSLNWYLKPEIADWPEGMEMRWEGDDRARTHMDRFLGLPRHRPNLTIAWHQLREVEHYDLDRVRLVPTLEDTHAPVDEIEDELVSRFINQDILDAMECIDEQL